MSKPLRNPGAVLIALAAASEACPHLRIGQLISNALPLITGKDPCFYIEDADLAAALLRYAEGK